MPDQNANPTPTTTPTTQPVANPVPNIPESPVVVTPDIPEKPADTTSSPVAEIIRKIGESQNVLIALSSDPSVDEMAAAIGLSLFLDRLGKRATAIYSGATPNALEFLKPEETFEPTADTLQDFVIALNKDKADHLRYKLDGDFVKVYITPYKTRISAKDLDYSYGDFNVDLVLALDVANGIDLDSALREHGRIMHDATIVNITTGKPGKLGEIEWSDKSASSVSEMIAKMLYDITDAEIGKEEATAFLTGIVAATDRFSNASTTPETMQISSRLMESGANQQLISKNITPDIENEMANLAPVRRKKPAEAESADPTKLDIEHEEPPLDESQSEQPADGSQEENKDTANTADEISANELSDDSTEKETSETSPTDNSLLDDLKAAEESLSQTGGETVPENSEEPIKIDSATSETPEEIASDSSLNIDQNSATDFSSELPQVETPGALEPQPSESSIPTIEPTQGEKVIQPSIELGANSFQADDNNKYSQMLENALESVGANPVEPVAPIASPADNPAAVSAPSVPSSPEINGVPEINYMPMPGDETLPPPPAPPIDMNVPISDVASGVVPTENVSPASPIAVEPIQPAAPAAAPTPEPLGQQPAMQDQVYNPQAVDPGAFKIPGIPGM